MRRSLKRCARYIERYLTPLKASFCLLCLALPLATCVTVAYPAYREARSLWQERGALAQKQVLLARFAAEQEGYATKRARMERELATLQARLPMEHDGTRLQLFLRKKATERGLTIRELSLGETRQSAAKSLAKDAQEQVAAGQREIAMELVGDYFAVLRWLQEAEQGYFRVRHLELKPARQGYVRMSVQLIAP